MAAEPGCQPRVLRQGLRVRTLNSAREAAVRAGLGEMRESVRELRGRSLAMIRLAARIDRILESYGRCRKEAWAARRDLRERATRAPDGQALLWTPEPCDVRGCEECGPFHALRELAEWNAALEQALPGPVAVFALTAPGWGLRETRKAAVAFFQSAAVRHALGPTAGYLIAEAYPQPGYALHVVVPADRADAIAGTLLVAWRRRMPFGWLRRVDDLPPQTTALEALTELRVRSEQALPLLVFSSRLDPAHGARLLAEELGGGRGGCPQRLVVAPALRALARERRAQPWGEEELPLAAGGSPGLAGSASAAAQAHGVGGQDAPNRGMEVLRTVPIPLSGGACAEGPSASTAYGSLPAGGADERQVEPRRAGDASGAPTQDEEGWVPCPWDSRLEMRPAKGRRIPWHEVLRRADRGELVPIMHNGRVIGYRTPPTPEVTGVMKPARRAVGKGHVPTSGSAAPPGLVGSIHVAIPPRR